MFDYSRRALRHDAQMHTALTVALREGVVAAPAEFGAGCGEQPPWVCRVMAAGPWRSAP